LFAVIIETLGCNIETSSLDTSLDSLLNDLHKRINLIRQLRVDFTKTRHSSSFKAPVSVKGTLIYQRPGNFFMRYRGGVDVQVLSNGNIVRIVHDEGLAETFVLNSDRNAGIFSDPWIELIATIGRGGFDKLLTVELVGKNELIDIDFVGKNQRPFEHVKRMTLSASHFGEIKHFTVVFSDGDFDEINFDSWSVLLDTDPEIVDLETRLKTISAN